MSKATESRYIITDCGCFFLGCPELLNKHKDEDSDWFIDFLSIEDFTKGQMTFVGVDDGIYHAIICQDDIPEQYKKYARELIHTGVETVSGHIVMAGAENLPGGGDPIDAHTKQDGVIKVELSPGQYNLDIYGLDTDLMDDDDFKQEHTSIIVVIKPRKSEFKPLEEEPFLFREFDAFVFPELQKKRKVQLGKTMRAKVRKTPKTESGLKLHEDFSIEHKLPQNYSDYEFALKSYEGVQWKDYIIANSIEIDEANKIIYFELVEKLDADGNPIKKGIMGKIKGFFK